MIINLGCTLVDNHIPQDEMALNVRKPVFRGVRTTKVQTSLLIPTD